MPLALVLAVIVAVVASGCGTASGERAPEDRAASGSGRLVVEHDRPELPRYIEGAVSHLRLVRADTGELIEDGPVADGPSAPTYMRELPAARYRLVSYQRPCDGNCGMLDPPTDRCATKIDVAAGETLHVTIGLPRTGGCEIELRAGPISPGRARS
jgi:hypothetical protein